MRSRILILTVLALVPVMSLADPGPSSRYLLSEPLSLMDFAVFKANIDLLDHAEYLTSLIRELDDDLNITAYASYHSIRDEFILNYILQLADDPKKYCLVIFNRYEDSSYIKNSAVIWFTKSTGMNMSTSDRKAFIRDMADTIVVECISVGLEERFLARDNKVFWSEGSD